MTPRRVTYVSVSNNAPASVVTGAETWGALKSEFPEIGALAQGKKAYIRETGVDVTYETQQLPTADFTLYFLIEKNKSGNGQVEEAIEEFIETVIAPIYK